jgi:hypothetical protein
MQLVPLLGPDLLDIVRNHPEAIGEGLRPFHPADVAEIVGEIPREDQVRVLENLTSEQFGEVLPYLGGETVMLALTQPTLRHHSRSVWSAAASLHQLPLSHSRSGELRPAWRAAKGGSSTLPLWESGRDASSAAALQTSPRYSCLPHHHRFTNASNRFPISVLS